MARQYQGGIGQGIQLVANGGGKHLPGAASPVGSTDSSDEQRVAGEDDPLTVEADTSGGMTRGMNDRTGSPHPRQ